ncbi:MAG TPA: hypothetical protein VKD90_17015 [Gemmataceae bacterium]|nr:hypothetical protein [Gemmataceae bacterium]
MPDPVLTPELKAALADRPGQPVRVIDPDTRAAYVLIDAGVFEHMAGLAYDDSPWSDEETAALAAEVGERIGWDEMAEYDHYPDRPK